MNTMMGKTKSTLVKSIASAIVTLLCFIPLEILIGLYVLVGPSGFWERFAIIGAGLILGGAVQFTFAIVWGVALFYIWTELK